VIDIEILSLYSVPVVDLRANIITPGTNWPSNNLLHKKNEGNKIKKWEPCGEEYLINNN